MFLKRLEVIGFKSFADRIGIDFVPGVTAVVGPNGSGKSNVTDAIRWVLGEQSAKSLRGAKMEDVIFAGSDSRKPLNFAEVTLILDNEDERMNIPYTEISVTRRVYRSGDSEYLLNNQQCRLKDITDLFMDSGLGKEAFSIISQGRVDEILNSRPDDRRSIFEEAAGVLKYKMRKRKAEHKLVETDDNLNRVLDILHEIDTRLEPLKIQASSANDYIRMTTELKDFDISLIVHDLITHATQLAAIEAEHQQLSATEKAHNEQITVLEAELKALRQALKQVDDVLDESQEQLVEASSEAERWEGRKALLNEKQSNNEKHIQQLEQQYAQAKEAHAELVEAEQQRKAQFAEKQQQVQQLRAAVKQLEQALSRTASEIEAEIEQAKNDYINLLNEEASVKSELKHLDQQLVAQNENVERMSGRSQEMLKQLQQAVTHKEQVAQLLHKAEAAIQELKQQYDAVQMKLKTTSSQFEEKQAMLYKAYQHHQQLKSRKDTLAELEADFSGFFHGVKEVLLARDKGELTGIEGAVAELLQVQPKYSKALETALGGASQHIVTATEQHAQKAIGWLKQRRAGRATFLPKSVMKSRKLAPHQISVVKEHPEFVAMADDLVTFDETNRTIMENLLGNVFVAQTLQGASQIARLIGFKYRVVTLDGDIVNAGGSLTGGATKQQSSFFSRKAELDELAETIVKMQQSIEAAERTVAQHKEEIAAYREQLETMKLAGDQLRADEQAHRSKLMELDLTIKNFESTMSLTSFEQSNISSIGLSLSEQKEVASTRLEQLKLELANKLLLVDELTEAKVQSETHKDALREQLAVKKADLAVAQEQLVQIQAATAEIQLNLTKADKLLENIAQEMQWLQQESGEEGPTIEEITETVAKWTTRKEQLSVRIQEKRDERTAKQEEAVTREETLTEMQRVHKGYLEAIRGIEVKRSRLHFEVTSLNEQLEENYELDFEDAQDVAIEIEDVEAVRRKVRLLKQSIEELGPVNLTAIEEYERVVERSVFLKEQHDDLIKAQETLHKAIEEMDEEMTARFTETFNSVRAQFKITFRELFGGGQADLVCTDPTNMLETGIEIIAQPPGKKLQNLSLLSGGERALTAIALLFAILNTRPVPFCILDEVEAALDESNVVRYSEYLKKFSSETQFIVITHRKGTMEGADVLYGITMQESGVSKLVSVRLEEEPVLVE